MKIKMIEILGNISSAIMSVGNALLGLHFSLKFEIPLNEGMTMAAESIKYAVEREIERHVY